MTYDVHLEIFEGPLDLLLYLIRKNDLEIAEIPIAQITEEYLSYLGLMKDLNLEIAGEFLVMASTLMQIKARMLLPTSETEQEEGPNPLEELKTKLIEYQRFKEVAQVLSQREGEFAQMYYRPEPIFDKDDYILQVSLFDLIDSFNNVLRELPTNVKEIVYQEIPIETKIREIMDMMEGRRFLTFREILVRQPSRIDLVVSFLAVLELTRLKQIIIRQTQAFHEIRIYRVGEHDDGSQGELCFTPEEIAEAEAAAEAAAAQQEEQASRTAEEMPAAALAPNEGIPAPVPVTEGSAEPVIPAETVAAQGEPLPSSPVEVPVEEVSVANEAAAPVESIEVPIEYTPSEEQAATPLSVEAEVAVPEVSPATEPAADEPAVTVATPVPVEEPAAPAEQVPSPENVEPAPAVPAETFAAETTTGGSPDSVTVVPEPASADEAAESHSIAEETNNNGNIGNQEDR